MLLTTARAPEDFAMRVAAPLCWTTFAFPSMVVMPPAVVNLKPLRPIFDLARRAWMLAWICESERRGAVVASRLWAGLAVGGREWGWAERARSVRRKMTIFIP